MRSLSALTLVLLLAGCDVTDGGRGGAPRSAEILRVSVDDLPFADEDGRGWDGDAPLSDGPEVYFRLFDADVDYLLDPGADRLNPRDDASVVPLASDQPWYDDAEVGDLSLVWEVAPGYVVRDLDDPLYLALFDYDPFDADDGMAESEVFRLRDVAPRSVTGQAQIVTLDGVDRDGDGLRDFRVRLTVEFFD